MPLRILPVLLAILGFLAMPAHAFETTARQALVMDYDTGTVLFAKDADKSLPPASMSKLMTLTLVFEALEDGRISLDDTFRVSAKAAQKGGSKMFVREGSRVRVDDLLQGVIVDSGNDACIVLAEGLAGSEAEFVKQMNLRARELGMNGSNFANSTGWPGEGQRMSARDLVFLARRMIKEFPQYYHYFAQESFTWEGITQTNRDPLLTMDIGADGLKTGHTEEAGYGLVGSAVQNGRRVVFMLGGMQSSAERASEGERVTRWAFREFAMKTLFKANQAIDTVKVWLGDRDTVEMILPEEISLLLPLSDLDKITAEYTFMDTVKAPVKGGQELGVLKIDIPGRDPLAYPLVAADSVAAGGFVERVKAAADLLLMKIRAKTAEL